jgi:hypothetical protein
VSDLNVIVALSFQKSGVSESFDHSQTATMSIAGYKVQMPTIGTSVASLSTSEVSTLGYTFLRSLVTTTQTTCTITFGKMNGTAFVGQTVLRPNEQAVMRLAPGTYAAQAAGEGYKLFVATLEE